MKNILLKALLGMISFLIINSVFCQNDGTSSNDLDELRSQLVGNWKFVKVVDDKENQIESIKKDGIPNAPPGFGSDKNGKITIKASGPDLTFNNDSTYSMKFNPGKTETGKWRLISKNELEYIDITNKGTSAFNTLEATAKMFNKKLDYDKDGNIISSISYYIILSKNELRIKYEEKYFQVYMKE